MDGANRDLIAAVRRGLAERADPAKAPGMQAYMKSAMPYYGVQAPAQRALYREVFAACPLDSFDSWQATTLALWREAARREERYAAIELTGYKTYRRFRAPQALPLYEEIVVTGAWWDLVDPIATQRLGELLHRYPESTKPAMLDWSHSADLWKRRAAILCQVNAKRETDLDLLYTCIGPNLDDKDFFIRKAIGWALRSYAWIDQGEIVRYVREHESRLSGLSRREALKNVKT